MKNKLLLTFFEWHLYTFDVSTHHHFFFLLSDPAIIQIKVRGCMGTTFMLDGAITWVTVGKSVSLCLAKLYRGTAKELKQLRVNSAGLSAGTHLHLTDVMPPPSSCHCGVWLDGWSPEQINLSAYLFPGCFAEVSKASGTAFCFLHK